MKQDSKKLQAAGWDRYARYSDLDAWDVNERADKLLNASRPTISFRSINGYTFSDHEWAWIFKYFPHVKDDFRDDQYPDKSKPYVCIKDLQMKTSKGFGVGRHSMADYVVINTLLNELDSCPATSHTIDSDGSGLCIEIDLYGIDHNGTG